MFVYTIQPVVKLVVQPVWQPVVQPVWQPVVSCKRGIIILRYLTANIVFSGVNLGGILGTSGGSRRLGWGKGVEFTERGVCGEKNAFCRLKWCVLVNSERHFWKSGGQLTLAPSPHSNWGTRSANWRHSSPCPHVIYADGRVDVCFPIVYDSVRKK